MSRSDLLPGAGPVLSVAQALYRAGRDYKGGVTALALEMGVDYDSLQKKLHIIDINGAGLKLLPLNQLERTHPDILRIILRYKPSEVTKLTLHCGADFTVRFCSRRGGH